MKMREEESRAGKGMESIGVTVATVSTLEEGESPSVGDTWAKT